MERFLTGFETIAILGGATDARPSARNLNAPALRESFE